MRPILMTGIAALLYALPPAASADLYRWVDPESGSIKYSSYPPPWYGKPELERRAPKVTHLPSPRDLPKPQPEAADAKGRAKPATPPTAADAPGGALQGVLATLDAQRKKLLAALSALPERQDFDRAGQGFQQQMEAYQAVTAELDRMDPRGAQARRADSRTLIEELREGLGAAFSTKPPAAPRGERPR